MRCLVLAMVLAAMQAPSPVPRKAADHDTANGRDNKTNAKADKRPAAQTMPSEKAVAPPGGETESKNIKGTDDKHPMGISELPSVSIKRDWMDCAYLILTGLLVLVTATTFGAIWWQARETARAARATEKAASAAELNAKTLINVERAWVLVDIGKIPEFTPDPNTLQILWVAPDFQNFGRTYARIIRFAARKHRLPRNNELPAEPEYPEPTTVDLILPPALPTSPVPVGIPTSDFLGIREQEVRLYIYGFVDYLDAADIQRQTRFCYRYLIPGGFDPKSPGFYIASDAPSAYIGYT